MELPRRLRWSRDRPFSRPAGKCGISAFSAGVTRVGYGRGAELEEKDAAGSLGTSLPRSPGVRARRCGGELPSGCAAGRAGARRGYPRGHGGGCSRSLPTPSPYTWGASRLLPKLPVRCQPCTRRKSANPPSAGAEGPAEQRRRSWDPSPSFSRGGGGRETFPAFLPWFRNSPPHHPLLHIGKKAARGSVPPPRLPSRTKSAGEEMGNKMVAQTFRKNATGPNFLRNTPLS